MGSQSWLRRLGWTGGFFGVRARRRERRLQLVETLALGDRRFVAVLNVDGRDFLVGATPNTVALLGELAGGGSEFANTVMFPTAGVQ